MAMGRAAAQEPRALAYWQRAHGARVRRPRALHQARGCRRRRRRRGGGREREAGEAPGEKEKKSFAAKPSRQCLRRGRAWQTMLMLAKLCDAIYLKKGGRGSEM